MSAFDIVPRLHAHCLAHHSFNELAERLNWTRESLALFFENVDPTMDAVFKVAHAMDLTLDIKVTPIDPETSGE